MLELVMVGGRGEEREGERTPIRLGGWGEGEGLQGAPLTTRYT